jgi:hypothetical protein
MAKKYSVLSDPLFYIMLGFFALLTTGLASILGQPRFLPISQTLALFAFVSIAFRRRQNRSALISILIWLILQMATLILLTRVATGQVEWAFNDGFHYRSDFIGWFYGTGPLPASLVQQPGYRILELIGVLVGSLFSGGLLGIWFLVRAANLTAYGAGALWQTSGDSFAVFGGLPLWALLRLAGYAGFVTLLAEPLFSGNWSLRYYLTNRRRLLLISAGLLGAAILLELTIAQVWPTLFA